MKSSILVILKTPRKETRKFAKKRQSNGTWVSFYGKLTSIVAVCFVSLTFECCNGTKRF